MRRMTGNKGNGRTLGRTGIRGGGLVVGAAVALSAGTALAATVALTISSNVSVTPAGGSTVREAIVATTHGRPVYRLTGDSVHHQECTAANTCFMFWPPVTVSSDRAAKLARGIHGKLTVWHRGQKLQLVLAGQPLYMFIGDGDRAHRAAGEGIKSFGGVWHVATPSGRFTKSTSHTTTSTTTRTSSTSTMTSTACYYPPC